MSFFPLPYSATIKKESAGVPDRSGQVEVARVDIAVKKCLFLETSGNKKMVGKEDFESIFAFYVEPSSPIDVGDLIVDIKDKAGNIVEAGPLEVLSAKRTPGLSGKIHHISCKVKGLA